MKKRRMWGTGSALAGLLALGLIAACEDAAMEAEEPAATPPGQAPMTLPPENDEGPPRAYEQPGQTPPGQAPMAEPWERPAEEMDPERQ